MLSRCTFAGVVLAIGWAALGVGAGDGGKKKAELEWARGVADDFLIALKKDGDLAAPLLTADYAKDLIANMVFGPKTAGNALNARTGQIRSGFRYPFDKATITSEGMAPDRDEAQFKGEFDYPSCTRSFVLRVVKEKDSGRWRIGLLFAGDEKPREKKPEPERTGDGQAQQPPSADALIYKFVNKTNGKFTDDQCFWSLNAGKEWHSFAKEPTVRCPMGNGRVYFRLGAAPKNFDDRQAYWDFIEYAYGKGTWHGNTTQVDAFCIPMTIDLGNKKVGIMESRQKLFEAFRKEAPKEFKACVKGDFWILSPCRAGFDKEGPHGKYFDKYIDAVWDMYSQEKKTPSGKWLGKVVQGALTFTPLEGGKPISCARKPTTQEIFLGTGVLGANPRFCAAINRHVLADPADWNNPATFYKAEPCNWYSKFLHQHSLDHKAYGFCYDDVSDQAAFFSGKGQSVIVSLYWDR